MAKTKKSERFDAIYARQSVDKRDSVSIEAQIDDCKVKCSGKIRVYKDNGYSGKLITCLSVNDQRLTGADHGTVHALITWLIRN